MMNNVVINDVVEEVSAKEPTASINRTYSAFGVGPRCVGVVRH